MENVTLQNTPLLINNICKSIYLKAASPEELKEMSKKYEMLLIKCLTNAYQLSTLHIDKNYIYTKLPDGNYQTSMLFSFSGKKKEKITNPEETLQNIKTLMGLEVNKKTESIRLSKVRHVVKRYYNTIILPIETREGENEIDVISNTQYNFLQELIENKDITKVNFIKQIKKTDSSKVISLKVDYDYREVIEIPSEQSISNELEDK